jgi:hypothetical protein
MATGQNPKRRDEPVDVDLDLDALHTKPPRTFRVGGRVYSIPAEPPNHVLTEALAIHEQIALSEDGETALRGMETLQGLIDELARMYDPEVTHVPLNSEDILRVWGLMLGVPRSQIEAEVRKLNQAETTAKPRKTAKPKSRRSAGARSRSR